MQHRFDLQRFVAAQESSYPGVLAELRRGLKTGHWIWFIFPQLKGLGRSSTALHYGIASIEEAAEYLQHPVLGPRLEECAGLVNQIPNRTSRDIFGDTDSMKFRSSMTLFSRVSGAPRVFEEALNKYYNNGPDSLTLDLLGLRVENRG